MTRESADTFHVQSFCVNYTQKVVKERKTRMSNNDHERLASNSQSRRIILVSSSSICDCSSPFGTMLMSPGEFDAVTCFDGRLVVHDARMHPDMVKLCPGQRGGRGKHKNRIKKAFAITTLHVCLISQ